MSRDDGALHVLCGERGDAITSAVPERPWS